MGAPPFHKAVPSSVPPVALPTDARVAQQKRILEVVGADGPGAEQEEQTYVPPQPPQTHLYVGRNNHQHWPHMDPRATACWSVFPPFILFYPVRARVMYNQ